MTLVIFLYVINLKNYTSFKKNLEQVEPRLLISEKVNEKVQKTQ